MVVGAENIVTLKESVVQGLDALYARSNEIGSRTRIVREYVLKGGGGGRHCTVRGVQPRQLRAERINLCGSQRLTRIYQAQRGRWIDRCGHRDGRRGRVGRNYVSQVRTQTLEAGKPEELVLENRSADRRAKLFQRRRGDRRYPGS